MRPAFLVFTCCLLSGCGSRESETLPQQTQPTPQPPSAPTAAASTPYGDARQIEQYLQKINPYIQEVGKIQLEVDKQVGSTGKATGANLAPVMEKFKPRLEKAIEEFSQIVPPPLLASFHDDIKRLMVLRLDAYNATIRGWAIEQKTGEQTAYEEAERKLREANQLIAALNGEMRKINQALSDSAQPAQTATSD